jgi:hypothetical protein
MTDLRRNAIQFVTTALTEADGKPPRTNAVRAAADKIVKAIESVSAQVPIARQTQGARPKPRHAPSR